MKSKFLFIAISLALYFCACTKDNFSNSFIEQSSMQKSNATPEDDETIDVRDYVENNSAIFGETLIFDTYEEVDSLLTYIENMNYLELRNWYRASNFYSPILESNIKYDSIFAEVAIRHGVPDYILISEPTFEEEIYVTNVDSLYNEFKEILLQNPNLISITNEYTIFEPLNCIDEEDALCNDKNIFIVDEYVHYYTNEFIAIIPITEFDINVRNMDFEALRLYIQECSLRGKSSYIVSRTHPFKHTSTNGIYKMALRVKAYDSCNFWGVLFRRMHVNIRNYKNGCLKRLNTDINFYCLIDPERPIVGEPIDMYINTNEDIKWKTFKRKIPTPQGANQFRIRTLNCTIVNSAGVEINLNINN